MPTCGTRGVLEQGPRQLLVHGGDRGEDVASGRTGSAPRPEVGGYARGADEGARREGEMARPLGGQEGVGGDAEARVVVEAAPAATLEVIQAQLVLELLVVALDPPAELGQADDGAGGGRLRHGGQPVVGRGRVARGPFD